MVALTTPSISTFSSPVLRNVYKSFLIGGDVEEEGGRGVRVTRVATCLMVSNFFQVMVWRREALPAISITR